MKALGFLLIFLAIGGCENPFGEETTITLESTTPEDTTPEDTTPKEPQPVAIKIMSVAGGAGSEVDTFTLLNDTPTNLFAISVDSNGDYVADVTVNWTLNNALGTFGQSSGSSTTLTPAGAPGTSVVTATHAELGTDTTGNISLTYTPTNFSNLTLWLKADYGVTVDGSNFVDSWEDLSGNSNNASQTGGSRPLLVDSFLNNKPVLRFDGSDDYLETVGSAVSGTSARSIFIVARNITDTGTYNALLDLTHTVAGAGTNFGITVEAAVRISGNRVFNEGIAAGETKVMSILNDMGDSAGAIEVYLDGVAATQASVVNNAINTLTNPVWIGQAAFANSNCNCDIAEVIVYDTKLSPTDRQDIESYLETKYGL